MAENERIIKIVIKVDNSEYKKAAQENNKIEQDNVNNAKVQGKALREEAIKTANAKKQAEREYEREFKQLVKEEEDAARTVAKLKIELQKEAVNREIEAKRLASKVASEYNKLQIKDAQILAKEKQKADYEMLVSNQKTQGLIAKNTGTANYALVNLTRTMSDAPFFMRSMEMGIISISNNLDPLIQSFVQAKNEAGSWKTALKNIGGSIIGSGGILLAFSAINAAITAFALAQDGAKKKTNENTEALKKHNDELSRMKGLLSSFTEFEDPFTGKKYQIDYKTLGDNIQYAAKSIDQYRNKISELEKKEKGINAQDKGILDKLIDVINPFATMTPKQQQKNAELLGKDEKGTLDYYKNQLSAAETYYDSMSKTYNDFKDKMNLLGYGLTNNFISEKTDDKSGTNNSKAIKEIENQYDELYRKLYDEQIKFKMSEYEYSKYLINRTYEDELVKNAELLEKGNLSKEQAMSLTIEAHKVMNNELLDLDIKYIAKQNEAKAKADKVIERKSQRELKKEQDQRMRDLREEYQGVSALADSAAQTLRDGFMQAWQDIFGEANSLLEQFMSNLVGALASIGTGQLANWLFNGILGFVNPTAGIGASIATAGGSNRAQTMNLNLVLDSQVLDSYTVKTIGGNMQVARNQRRLA